MNDWPKLSRKTRFLQMDFVFFSSYYYYDILWKYFFVKKHNIFNFNTFGLKISYKISHNFFWLKTCLIAWSHYEHTFYMDDSKLKCWQHSIITFKITISSQPSFGFLLKLKNNNPGSLEHSTITYVKYAHSSIQNI